jgi:uncharacterized protein with PIN domain
MPVKDVRCRSSMFERKDKVEAALVRLKSLKWRISELRAQCEVFKFGSEKQEGFVCNECGNLIEQGEEVTVKDSFGNLKSHYHKECFKEIWVSQNWHFDDSS